VKVFITGADGALGQEVQNILKAEKVNFLATDIKQLDITYFKKVSETVTNYRPDVIIHCAAISDVDWCEKNKDLAYRINVLGTLGLANMAKKIEAKIAYLSTNFVFDGETEQPYGEYEAANPINEYGRTKYLGERCVRDACEKCFIIRTAWLFGPHSKTFVSKFLQSKVKPAHIDVICDQTGSFTYIPDLARAILSLIVSDHFGLYHIVNSGLGSWLDFMLRAKEFLRFNTEIRPVKTEELGLPAPRPRFAALASKNYEFLFEKKLRVWTDALADFIKSIQGPGKQ
jgi:dTDP-4-dehydrorhamnose reductase